MVEPERRKEGSSRASQGAGWNAYALEFLHLERGVGIDVERAVLLATRAVLPVDGPPAGRTGPAIVLRPRGQARRHRIVMVGHHRRQVKKTSLPWGYQCGRRR